MRGITQVALAKRLGISFQQVQKYETGQNRLSISRALAISSILKVSPMIFFPQDHHETEYLDRKTLRFIKLFHTLSEKNQDKVLRALQHIVSMVASSPKDD